MLVEGIASSKQNASRYVKHKQVIFRADTELFGLLRSQWLIVHK